MLLVVNMNCGYRGCLETRPEENEHIAWHGQWITIEHTKKSWILGRSKWYISVYGWLLAHLVPSLSTILHGTIPQTYRGHTSSWMYSLPNFHQDTRTLKCLWGCSQTKALWLAEECHRSLVTVVPEKTPEGDVWCVCSGVHSPSTSAVRRWQR